MTNFRAKSELLSPKDNSRIWIRFSACLLNKNQLGTANGTNLWKIVLVNSGLTRLLLVLS